MTAHANSLAAYHDGAKEFTKRHALVIDAVRKLGKATDRQIKELLGFSDMNAVRPRVTELVQASRLEECGNVVDAVTRRPVRTVRMAGQPEAVQTVLAI